MSRGARAQGRVRCFPGAFAPRLFSWFEVFMGTFLEEGDLCALGQDEWIKLRPVRPAKITVVRKPPPAVPEPERKAMAVVPLIIGVLGLAAMFWLIAVAGRR